jgi:hypothetical protein
MTATVPARYTAADLIYDADRHTSKLPDGTPVPHVTAILSATGVGEDFDALAGRGPRFRSMIDNARERGTAVHADCHAYDDDDLDWNGVDHRVRPYVEAWAEFRMNKNLTPMAHARERRIYHPIYGYTGILDGVFALGLGDQRCLIDIKTGNPESAAAHIQTAAYEEAWNAEHPDVPITSRWAVWLTPRNRVPYRIFDYSSRPDACEHFGIFLACLTVYREIQKRKSREF